MLPTGVINVQMVLVGAGLCRGAVPHRPPLKKSESTFTWVTLTVAGTILRLRRGIQLNLKGRLCAALDAVLHCCLI